MKSQTVDSRYSATLEWCGKAEQRYVARFCGEWLSQHIASLDAMRACIAHRKEWLAGAGL